MMAFDLIIEFYTLFLAEILLHLDLLSALQHFLWEFLQEILLLLQLLLREHAQTLLFTGPVAVSHEVHTDFVIKLSHSLLA